MQASLPTSVDSTPHIDWPLLLSMQQRCMRATTIAELGFVIANETWHLVPYVQASLFRLDKLGRLSLQAVSGLGVVEEDTPFTLWLTRLCNAVAASEQSAQAHRLEASMLAAGEQAVRDGWSEWWPPHGVFVPLMAPSGMLVGGVFLVREQPWNDNELTVLSLLAETWGYCCHALQGDRPRLREYWDRLRSHPRRKQWLTVLAIVCLFPVRLSALAPAEIVPLQAEVVAAPMDGVVTAFHVPPNTVVKQGQALFSLDDTTLRNRREIARQGLAVARADALATQQKAFDNPQSRADLAALAGKVREREAEVAWLEESLGHVTVSASIDGIFTYSDANDWLGKPVVTGERIAHLAQANDLGVLMWLPVGDAINLEPGAAMRVYLQVSPLSSISAELVQTSYQATLSPDGIASYRIRGKLAPDSDARLGLRGVAKVYGDWRPLLYWVLRRPLGAARQAIGI